jgi:hypothetical protein
VGYKNDFNLVSQKNKIREKKVPVDYDKSQQNVEIFFFLSETMPIKQSYSIFKEKKK